MHMYKISIIKNGSLHSVYYIEKSEQVYGAVYNILNEYTNIEKNGIYPNISFSAEDKLHYRCSFELKIHRISTITPKNIGTFYKAEWELYPKIESGADDDINVRRDVANYIDTLTKTEQEFGSNEELFYVYCMKEEKWLQYAARGFGNTWTKDKNNANKFNKASLAHIEAYFREYEFKEEIVFVKV